VGEWIKKILTQIKRAPRLSVAATAICFSLLLFGPGVFTYFRSDDFHFLFTTRGRSLNAILEWLSPGGRFSYYLYWDPVPLAAFFLRQVAFGLWAPGHHLTSLALHLLNFYLLIRLVQRLSAESARWVSIVTAFIFLTRASSAEPVLWLTANYAVFGLTFGLLTLLALHKYCASGVVGYYFLSLGLVFLQLISSTGQLGFLLILPLLLARFGPAAAKSWRTRAKWVLLHSLPFILPVLLFAGITKGPPERTVQRRQALIKSFLSPQEPAKGWARFIGELTLKPFESYVPHNMHYTNQMLWVCGAVGASVLAILFAVGGPLASFGAWWTATAGLFFALWVPSAIADRYLYVSTPGIAMVIGGLADRLARALRTRLQLQASIAAVVTVCFCGIFIIPECWHLSEKSRYYGDSGRVMRTIVDGTLKRLSEAQTKPETVYFLDYPQSVAPNSENFFGLVGPSRCSFEVLTHEEELPNPNQQKIFLVLRYLNGDVIDWTESYRRGMKGHFDDMDPAITYSGPWNATSETKGHLPWAGYHPSVHWSRAAGASATLRFKGTWINLRTRRDMWSGLADVYVDGHFVRQVNTLSSRPVYGVIERFGPFSGGWHVFEIRVANTRGSATILDFEVPDQDRNAHQAD